MAKCIKVKNPCKICLGPVTQKTGLQCQGACESWVHYACLNYTPGRIKDIKAGIIKVTCPCPDCKTTLPKEFRTDEAFSCTNIQCPANRPPQCGNTKCPLHSPVEKMNQTGYPIPQAHQALQAAQAPCPLGKCGNDCKQHVNPNPPLAGGPPLSSPCAPQGPLRPTPFTNPLHPTPPLQATADACIDFNKCPSGCTSERNLVGDMRRDDNVNNFPYMGNNLPSLGNNLPSLGTMEQMCNTIGLLSAQLNDMMAKMRNASGGNTKSCCPTNHANCAQSGTKSMCQNPCYCPENRGFKKF